MCKVTMFSRVWVCGDGKVVIECVKLLSFLEFSRVWVCGDGKVAIECVKFV